MTLTQRSTPELVGDIATDIGVLVRKEIELARIELMKALTARAIAAGAIAAAGVLGLLVVIFGGLAAVSALEFLIPSWAARLTVAGAFGLMAIAGLSVAKSKLSSPSLEPEETVRTLKEDMAWAKAQLRR